jgi:menaquinone-dependent protoporphyrinogen oxidase
MNRRQFLTRTAAGIGAVTVSCIGLTTLANQAPIDPSYEIFASGENAMNQKVLVTYASKAGSTMEVAQAVAKELTSRGFAVDVRPVKQAGDVKGYAAVVIGSAIRMGAPLSEAIKFVEKNSAALREVPAAFFAVHLMNMGTDETSQKARLAYLDPIRKLVPLQNEAFFAGVGDFAKVSFIEGLISKMVKSPEGDFRDWDAISSWGQSIFAQS